MALGTPTELVATGATADTVTTASFTPSSNATQFAFVVNRGSSAEIPTISDSLGGTWTPIDAGHDGTLAAARLFWQAKEASPSARTVTVETTGGGTQVGVHILEITGVNESDFTNVQSTLDADGDPAVTMSSYAANSLCLAYCLVNAGAAMTGPTDFTELYDVSIATNTRVHVSYDMTSPTTSLSWAGSNTESVAYGLEVKEAAGGNQDITGALFTDGDTFYAGTIAATYEILGSLFTDGDTFYSGSIDLFLLGGLFIDGDNFPTGIITTDYTITGALFTDSDTFYNNVIQLETDQDISGSLFVDGDTFHAASITTSYDITGNLYTDSDSFGSGVVSSEYNIIGNLFVDLDVFYTSTIEGGDATTPVAMLSYWLLKKRRKPGE